MTVSAESKRLLNRFSLIQRRAALPSLPGGMAVVCGSVAGAAGKVILRLSVQFGRGSRINAIA